MSQFKAIVHGHVQGVCFRAETVSQARTLGLDGYARNLPDGSVEVLAAGEEPALLALADFLKQGPRIARVDRVEFTWDDTSPVSPGFSIRY